jgi:hypothetical protein
MIFVGIMLVIAYSIIGAVGFAAAWPIGWFILPLLANAEYRNHLQRRGFAESNIAPGGSVSSEPMPNADSERIAMLRSYGLPHDRKTDR